MRSKLRRADLTGRVLALVLAAGGWAVNGVAAAALTMPNAVWRREAPSTVELRVSGELPPDSALLDVRQWRVSIRSLADDTTRDQQPARVERDGKLLILTLPEEIRPWDEKQVAAAVTVTYFSAAGKAFSVPVRHAPAATGTAAPRGYQAANGPADADIYLSGAWTTGRGARPTYAYDAKVVHRLVTAAGGEVGASFSMSAANEPNVDPDSIKAGFGYRRNFTTTPGLELRIDLPAGEFARRNDVRSLTGNVTLTAAPRAVVLGTGRFLAFEPFAGVELGRNLTRRVVSGDRAIARPLVGANAYLLALQPGDGVARVTLGATFALRLPRTDEPYVERRDGVEVVTLTRRARPHVGADLGLEWSEGYGISLQYRHGSLPPAFARVEHRLALSLTVKRKRR